MTRYGLRCLLLFVLSSLAFSTSAHAQPLADSLFEWRGYNRTSTAHVQVYAAPEDEERRPHVVVLREVAANRGPSTVDDVRYLADLIGRQFGLDPAEATWVVHWGAFSYAGAKDDARALLLRVTFRRTKSGRLSSPYWRVITPTDVHALTDRQWSLS